jgi:energy-converting hydrogenase Eha subunit E
MTIPFVLALVIGSIFAGGCTQRFGYYVPFMFASAVIVPISTGLFTTFHTDTGHAKWIGYQVLVGFGIGLSMQQPSMAAQTVLPKIDVPTGVSLIFFGQQLGGTVFVSVGQNILSSRLISGLAEAKIPGLDPGIAVNAGATNIRNVVQPEYLGAVLQAYNHALTTVYHVAVGTSCVLIVGAAFMEWKSIKQDRGNVQRKEQGKEVSETLSHTSDGKN